MNKEKLPLVSGFLPCLALAILMGFEYAFQNGFLPSEPYVYAMTEAAAFLFPFVIAVILMRGEDGPTMRMKGFRLRYFTFILFGSTALSFFCFLLNWLAASAFSAGFTAQNTVPAGSLPLWQVMLISIFLPAVCEELFFRAGILPAQEGRGFYPAMLFSALTFALIHGDARNLLGPLAAGLAYSYMTYITGSGWAAVTAHFINNSLSLGIDYLLERYAAVGLWRFFLIFVIVAFFVFLYLAMGRLEKLIERGRVPMINREGLLVGLTAAVTSPGLWLLAVMFAVKIFVFKA